MALIANVSFSKKIPVEGEQFSSQGYSLSLQTEITETEPSAIQTKLHQTFELVKSQVEHELANGNGKYNGLADPGSNTVPMPPTPGSGKASNAQIKFITDLAGRKGLSLSDINAGIRDRFGVDGLYDLDKKQASSVLDELKDIKKKAA